MNKNISAAFFAGVLVVMAVMVPIAAYAESKKPVPVNKAAFIGDTKTKLVHQPYCLLKPTIKAENRIGFPTKGLAVKSGYTPCPKCMPK